MLFPIVTQRLAATALAAVLGASGHSGAIELDVKTLLAIGAYEQAESAARAQFDALWTERAEGALEVATAGDLLVQALILNGKAGLAETLTIAQQTVQAKEAHLGPVHPDLVRSLVNVAEALTAAGEHGRAVEVAERAVGLCERSAGCTELATALDDLGMALTEAGRHQLALRSFDRSLALKEAAEAGAIEVARTLEAMALACQRAGDYKRAAPLIRRAVQVQEAGPVGHPSRIATLSVLAQQLWFEGDLPASREVSRRAVAAAESTLRPDHPTTAKAVRYLAGTAFDLGDLRQAHEMWTRALAMVERNFGPEHHETALYLHDVAVAEMELAEYPTARARLERALAIFERHFGRWHSFVASALHNLAVADARLGDFRKARQNQEGAVATWTRTLGQNHPFVAVALTELATLYQDQGLVAEALPLLQRALAIREKTSGPAHRDVARTLANQASAMMRAGRRSAAQAAARRALAIFDQLEEPDSLEHSAVLSLSAELQTARGDSRAARDHYEQALAIRGRVFGASNPTYAEAQVGLAQAKAELGDLDSAFHIALEAERTGRNHLRLLLGSLPERQALNYSAVRPRGLSLVLSLAETTPDGRTLSLDAVVRSRALVLDEMSARRKWDRATDQGDDPLRVQLIRAQQRLANLVVRGPGQLSLEQYATAIEETRREGELVEQARAEQNSQVKERDRTQVGLEAVLAALPPGYAMVSFVRYDRTSFRPQQPLTLGQGRRRSSATPSYLAFVLRHGATDPVLVHLGPAGAVEALIAAWRRGVVADVARVEGQPERVSSLRSVSVRLRRTIWDPVAAHIGDSTHVFVVADGAISLVPFAALPSSETRYLLDDGPLVHYLSAERDLVTGSSRPESLGLGLLAIGGAEYADGSSFARYARRPPSGLQLPTPDAQGERVAAAPVARPPSRTALTNGPQAPRSRTRASTCPGLRSMEFEALPASRGEAESVAALWRQYADAGAWTSDSLAITGEQATEGALKQSGPGRRVLHIATHGYFLSDECVPVVGARSVGGLVRTEPAGGKQQRARRPNSMPQTLQENPLLRAGLALAGANRRSAAMADEEDGILTAEEVAALDLEGVEWAVLSACDTGLGEVRAGEGILGLRRAFQIAGARTVIMSLWSVEDDSTRDWMDALYRARLIDRRHTAEAVREASLRVLRARRASGRSTNPFYWAAFVAAGDWR